MQPSKEMSVGFLAAYGLRYSRKLESTKARAALLRLWFLTVLDDRISIPAVKTERSL